MEEAQPIPREAREKLNEMGFRGPKHSLEPEIIRTCGEGQTVHATLKCGRFSIAAYESEEFGHKYTVYELAHYPEATLHSRAGCCGPVAVPEIRSIMECDLDRVPEFMRHLEAAGSAIAVCKCVTQA
jgi:hypothetical protein